MPGSRPRLQPVRFSVRARSVSVSPRPSVHLRQSVAISPRPSVCGHQSTSVSPRPSVHAGAQQGLAPRPQQESQEALCPEPGVSGSFVEVCIFRSWIAVATPSWPIMFSGVIDGQAFSRLTQTWTCV